MLEKMTEAIVSKLLEPYKVVRSDSATNTTEIDFAANFKNPPDILKVCKYLQDNRIGLDWLEINALLKMLFLMKMNRPVEFKRWIEISLLGVVLACMWDTVTL